MTALPAYSTFGDLSNRPASELAERVSSLAPVTDSRVFLTSGGSDSIDTATKMARRFWQLVGQPERTILIRRERAYHGMHTAGTSLAGIPANAAGHGELIEDVVQVRWDDADDLRSMIEQVGAEQGRGVLLRARDRRGRRVPRPRRLPVGRPRGLPRDRRAVRGRRGHHRLRPLRRRGSPAAAGSSSPTSSRAPRASPAATCRWARSIAAPWIAEPFWAEGAGVWRHGYTYSGHAAASAAALANLDIMEREGLCERARELEIGAERRARAAGLAPVGERGADRRRARRGPTGARRDRGRPGAAGARRSPRAARPACSRARWCRARCRSRPRW